MTEGEKNSRSHPIIRPTGHAGSQGPPPPLPTPRQIKAWDRRNESVVFVLEGHKDTVTGMAVSPNGASLLTNSMDNSLIQVSCEPKTTVRMAKRMETAQAKNAIRAPIRHCH